MKEFGSVSQAQLKAVGEKLQVTGDKISDAGSKLGGVIVEELFALFLDKVNDFVKVFALWLYNRFMV